MNKYEKLRGISFMKKYLKLDHRVNRSELTALTLVSLIIGITIYWIFGNSSNFFLVIIFIFYLMQCAKRYQDLNKSGVHGFVWWIVPFINLYFFYQLYFKKGDSDKNKYGYPSDFSFKKFGKYSKEKVNPSLNKPIWNNKVSIENKTIVSDEKNLLKVDKAINKSVKGMFTFTIVPEKFRDSEIYLHELFAPDGAWVNENDAICRVRLEINNSSEVEYATLTPNTSGYLEWLIDKDCKLEEGMIYYKLHPKGEYKNENTIDSKDFKHYFPKSSSYSLFSNESYTFNGWMVLDGEFVNKGDVLYKYKNQDDIEFLHEAEKDGYIDVVDKKLRSTLYKYDLLYSIRDQDIERVHEKYNNIPKIIIDEFNQSKNIVWDSVSSNVMYPDKPAYGIISKSDDGLVDMTFTFNYLEDTDTIIFHFDPKQIRPKESDRILFLFENDNLIEFELKYNPISLNNQWNERVVEYKSPILKNELELFANEDFKRWKIELKSEKREILGGEIGEYGYKFKRNLIIVIKKFASDYKKAVYSNIVDYQPIEVAVEEENIVSPNKKDESCHVYLMHDTTNGYYKIGISNKPYYRERTLQSEKPTIELIISKKFPIRRIAESIEKSLHSSYDDKRLRGEWFELDERDVKHIIESLK